MSAFRNHATRATHRFASPASGLASAAECGAPGLKPKRILVLCPFPQGVAAGQRLKYEQYFDDWCANGYDIVVSSFMDEAMWRIVYGKGRFVSKFWGVLRGYCRRLRDVARLRDFDLAYVFMWVTPFGTSLFERLTRLLSKRLIFDVEDNVLVGQKLPALHNPNFLITLLKGPGKASFLIRTADHVISASPFLNADYLKLNAKRACTYITPSVDSDRFIPKGSGANTRKITLGWTGTFSSKIYLDLLRPVLTKLARERDFRLVVIGNFEYVLDGVDLRVIQWTRAREIADLQDIDIGLYPLPIDDWVLGKAGLKAIQYMAIGLPSVATRVGTTPMIIDHGVHGLLVETQDEWLEALKTLIDDPGMRMRMGECARARAVARYSLRAVRQKYIEILDGATGRVSQRHARADVPNAADRS